MVSFCARLCPGPCACAYCGRRWCPVPGCLHPTGLAPGSSGNNECGYCFQGPEAPRHCWRPGLKTVQKDPVPGREGHATTCPAEDKAGRDGMLPVPGDIWEGLSLHPALPTGAGHGADAMTILGLPKASVSLSWDKRPFVWEARGQSCSLQRGVSRSFHVGHSCPPDSSAVTQDVKTHPTLR